jgi:hypothetical protein
MARGSRLTSDGLKVFPPPPMGFDALTATKRTLARHGLPERPDPRTQPALAALWERTARRYRGFEHVAADLVPADHPPQVPATAFALAPIESAGFELFSSAPFTVFSGFWTVPDLNFRTGGIGRSEFRTFFGLGFLDVHVEMTVDLAENVTSLIRIHTGAQLPLSVRPGDAISAILCLQTNSAGTATYYLANHMTSRTVNLTLDTGFPPAVTINAGISRSLVMGPSTPLPRFGVVYFDELDAFTTSGTRDLTNGSATTMTGLNGATLARPVRLNDSAFKVIDTGD